MLRIKSLLLASGCGLGLLFVACAHRAPTFSPTATPAAQSAILYGRFFIERKWALHNQLALWLQNMATHHNVYVYFDPDHPVYAVQVPAGKYRIAGFAGVNRAHELEVRHQTPHGPAAITAPFAAPPRALIYLGDFVGEATYDGMIMHWSIDSCSNNFAPTTVDFRAQYPNLGSAPATPRWKSPTGPRLDLKKEL